LTDFGRLRREFPSVNQVLLAFLANEVRMVDQRLLEALYMPVEKRGPPSITLFTRSQKVLKPADM
jgi:hypothetical protein